MKKVILIAIVLLAAIAFVNAQTKPAAKPSVKGTAPKTATKPAATPAPVIPAKEYLFKFTDEQIGGLWNILIFSQQNLQTSEAKASDVTKMITGISFYQKLIQDQLKPQVDTIKSAEPIVTAQDSSKTTPATK